MSVLGRRSLQTTVLCAIPQGSNFALCTTQNRKPCLSIKQSPSSPLYLSLTVPSIFSVVSVTPHMYTMCCSERGGLALQITQQCSQLCEHHGNFGPTVRNLIMVKEVSQVPCLQKAHPARNTQEMTQQVPFPYCTYISLQSCKVEPAFEENSQHLSSASSIWWPHLHNYSLIPSHLYLPQPKAILPLTQTHALSVQCSSYLQTKSV